jgi:hypothetical protein
MKKHSGLFSRWLLAGAILIIALSVYIFNRLLILDVFYWTQENIEIFAPDPSLMPKNHSFSSDFGFYSGSLQFLREKRRKGPFVLFPGYRSIFLAAGELSGGRDLIDAYYGGEPVSRALEKAGCDAFVPSGKEWMRLKEGWDRFPSSRLPVLASNMTGASIQEGNGKFARYSLFEAGGRKILLLGCIPRREGTPQHAPDGEDAETLRSLIKSIGHDFSILFTWSGDPARQANLLPEAGLVLEARRLLARYDKEGKHTPRKPTLPWADCRFSIGRTTLFFLPFLEHPLRMNSGMGIRPVKVKDPDLGNLLSGYAREYRRSFRGIPEKIGGSFLALAEADLTHERLRFRESRLGDLVADVLRREMHTDLALINHRSIRGGFGRLIFYEDLARCLPFRNQICTVFLTGRQLDMLLRRNSLENRRFLQVSGAEVAYRLNDEKSARIHLGGKPIEMDRIYSVATNDYLALGARGREPVFAQAPGKRWSGIPVNLILGDRLAGLRWIFLPAPRTLVCSREPYLEASELMEKGLKLWDMKERNRAVHCWAGCALIRGEDFKLPAAVSMRLDMTSRHRLLGDVFSKAGLADLALKEYQAQTASGLKAESLREKAALTLCREGRMEAALKVLSGLPVFPRQGGEIWLTALARLGLGEYKAALAELNRASAPRGPEALLLKGWLQLVEGDLAGCRLSWKKTARKINDRRMEWLTSQLERD